MQHTELCSSKATALNLQHHPMNLQNQPVNLRHQPVNLQHQPVNLQHQTVDLQHQPVNNGSTRQQHYEVAANTRQATSKQATSRQQQQGEGSNIKQHASDNVN
jgi:hypothetical protein